MLIGRHQRGLGQAWRAIVPLLCTALLAAAAGPDPSARYQHAPFAPHSLFIEISGNAAPGVPTLTLASEATDGLELTLVSDIVAVRHGDLTKILLRALPTPATPASRLLIDLGDGTRLTLPPPSSPRTRSATDIMLLVDDSHSMRRTDPQRRRVTAIETFARRATEHSAISSLSVASFTYHADLLLAPTAPPELPDLPPLLKGLKAAGRTDMDIGLRLAIKTLGDAPGKRKVIVILSDGKDAPGRYEDTHTRCQQLGWAVHTIGLSEHADQATLKRIAADTGGSFHYASTASELEAAFIAAAEALEQRVLVGLFDLTSPAIPGAATAPGFVLLDPFLKSARITSLGTAGSRLALNPPAPSRGYVLRGGEVRHLEVPPTPGEWQHTLTGEDGGTAHAQLRIEGTSRIHLIPFPIATTPDGDLYLDVLVGADDAVVVKELRALLSWPGGRSETRLSKGGGAARLYQAICPRPVGASGPLRLDIHADLMTADGRRIQRMASSEVSGSISPRRPTVVTSFAALSQSSRPIPARVSPLPLLPRALAVTRLTVAPRQQLSRGLMHLAPARPPIPLAEYLGRVTPAAEELIEDGGPPVVALPAAPAAPAPELRQLVPNEWRLPLAALLLILALVLLLLFLTRCRMNRMAKYLLASTVAHALLFVLTLNLLMETGTIDLAEVAPSIAVKLRTMEQELGIEILPPAPAIDVSEQATPSTASHAERLSAAIPESVVETATPERVTSADEAALSELEDSVPAPSDPETPEMRPIDRQMQANETGAEQIELPPLPEPEILEKHATVETSPEVPAMTARPEKVPATPAEGPGDAVLSARPAHRLVQLQEPLPLTPLAKPIPQELPPTSLQETTSATDAMPTTMLANHQSIATTAPAPKPRQSSPSDADSSVGPAASVAAARVTTARSTPPAKTSPSARPTLAQTLPQESTPLTTLEKVIPDSAPLSKLQETTSATDATPTIMLANHQTIATTAPSAKPRQSSLSDADSSVGPATPVAAARAETARGTASGKTSPSARPTLAEALPQASTPLTALEKVIPDSAPSPSLQETTSATDATPTTMLANHQPIATTAPVAKPLQSSPSDADSSVGPAASVAAARVTTTRSTASEKTSTSARPALAEALPQVSTPLTSLAKGIPDSAPSPSLEKTTSVSDATPTPMLPNHQSIATTAPVAKPRQSSPANADSSVGPATPVAAARVATTRSTASESMAPSARPALAQALPQASTPLTTHAKGIPDSAPSSSLQETTSVTDATPTTMPAAGHPSVAAAAAVTVRRTAAAAGDAEPADLVALQPTKSIGPRAATTPARAQSRAATNRLEVAARRISLRSVAAPRVHAVEFSQTSREGLTTQRSMPVPLPGDGEDPLAVVALASRRPHPPVVRRPAGGISADVPARSRATVARAPRRVGATISAPLTLPTAARHRPAAAASQATSTRLTAAPRPGVSAPPLLKRERGGSEIGVRMGSGSPSGSIRVDISLARYGGDWDCSPTAMLFLGHKMEERTGLAFEISDRVVSLDSPEIMKLPFIYLTGHRDFALSGAEIARLRQYLKGGGHLWADDSTHFNDHAFDRAFRREIQRVLPDLRIQRLSTEFAGFKTGYDLSRGYRGYAVPPGDKYRQDYIEGIEINGRVAVVYTRNDYGDGLNIDPNTHPLMTSLTNLSPAEMQEGSLRMGINLVLYFLGNQLGGDDMLAAVAQGLDTTESLAEVVLPKGTSTILAPTDQAGVWVPESWGDTASLTTDERGTTIAFTVSDKQKVALTHTSEPTALASSDVVLADIHNALPCGIRVALGLVDKERYFETKPYFLKPGDNTAVFDLGEKDFKSEASNWEYTAALPQPYQVERLTILLYAPRAGAVTIRNLRAVTPQ